MFAEIIIPLSLPKVYTWAIPPHLQNDIPPGSRVEVALKNNKRYAGIVKNIHNNAPVYPTQEVLSVLDNEPVLFPVQLQLWEWIADYYTCSEGEVMQAALPANLKLSSDTIICYNENHEYEITALSDAEYIVAEALDIKKKLKLREVHQLLNGVSTYTIVKKLINKKICYIWESLSEKYREKKETYILLNPIYQEESALEKLLNDWKHAPKQLDLLLTFLHLQKIQAEITRKQLLEKNNASPALLKGLTEKNILCAQQRAINRIALLPGSVKIDFELSQPQQYAFNQIENILKEKDVCLLHGITGSGKTLIYIKLIEQQIQSGHQVLFLLPEIALTTQIIRKLQHHFGGHAALYHSKFNPNERVELWNKVRNDEVKVVLGARSALFLPFRHLKFIIIDEEHDANFKQQDSAPRYHARDTAIYYASLLNAKVVLGSATPSIETYYNATQGKYGLVTLEERYGGASLPDIELIEYGKKGSKNKPDGIISLPLKTAVEASIKDGRQVILFQNKRGYAPYQICALCGWIPHCDHCAVSLTFHKKKDMLLCHYCGTAYPVIKNCIACGSSNFAQKNFGTEKIEELLHEELPYANIARMDTDSVRGKYDHEKLIQLFEKQNIDILVGTQMIVKGLDFDNVALVGIMDGDSILNFVDFRISEKAFQLIEQVSGRAGRKDKKGKVMIQISNVNHPLLPIIIQHDYKTLFNKELKYRKQYFYPPFSKIIKLQCRHIVQQTAREAAQYIAQQIHNSYREYLSGPTEPVVGKIRNQFIYELMLKLPKQMTVLQQGKQHIKNIITDLKREKKFSAVKFILDVDPV